MKLLKLGLISLVSFALLLTAISLLIPSQVRVSRAVDIQAPVSSIKPYLMDIGQWSRWNLYVDSLPNKKIVSAESLSSPDMNIRIFAASDTSILSGWGKTAGNPFTSHYRLIPHGSQVTTVQWYFDFNLRWYPWEKFSSIIYDQQFGPTMEKSLLQLKSLCE
jgi:hypothetical protein